MVLRPPPLQWGPCRPCCPLMQGCPGDQVPPCLAWTLENHPRRGLTRVALLSEAELASSCCSAGLRGPGPLHQPAQTPGSRTVKVCASSRRYCTAHYEVLEPVQRHWNTGTLLPGTISHLVGDVRTRPRIHQPLRDARMRGLHRQVQRRVTRLVLGVQGLSPGCNRGAAGQGVQQRPHDPFAAVLGRQEQRGGSVLSDGVAVAIG